MDSITTTTTTTDIYTDCATDNAGSAEGLLRCLTDRLHEENELQKQLIQQNAMANRNMYILYASALTFFMQAGFAMVCAGAVRKKNLQNTMLKNLLDACGAAIAFYAVGYAFAFGDDDSSANGFIGTQNFFLKGVDDLAFWLFQYAFSAASATIVAGTLAERCQMSAYFYYSILLSGFVYPITVHMIWSEYGVLSASKANPLFGVGVVDVAGGGVVHLTGGTTALVATWILGPRRGRFHDEQTGEPLAKPKDITGHNIGLQLLGSIILWFGWYGFNSGSALLAGGLEHGDKLAARAGTNTTLAGGAAGISALFLNFLVLQRTTGLGRYDLVLTMNGTLSGLVAITAGCAVVEPWAAVIIGAFAGGFYLLGSWMLVKFRLDDAVDAIPVHMTNGVWGMISTGLFAAPDSLQKAYDHVDHAGFFYFGSNNGFDMTLLGVQLVGILFIVVWTVGLMLPFFIMLQKMGAFRAGAMEEVLGLDRKEFGGIQMGGEDDQVSPDQIAKLSKQLEVHLRHRRHDNDNNNAGAEDHGSGNTHPSHESQEEKQMIDNV